MMVMVLYLSLGSKLQSFMYLFLAGDFMLLLYCGGIDFNKSVPKYRLSASVLLIFPTMLLLGMGTADWDDSRRGIILKHKSTVHNIGTISYSLGHSSIKNKRYDSRSNNEIKY